MAISLEKAVVSRRGLDLKAAKLFSVPFQTDQEHGLHRWLPASARTPEHDTARCETPQRAVLLLDDAKKLVIDACVLDSGGSLEKQVKLVALPRNSSKPVRL
jgi:hypothetical protein